MTLQGKHVTLLQSIAKYVYFILYVAFLKVNK